MIAAETILIDGTIRTLDPARPTAQALAIGGGLIVGVGAEDEVGALAAAGTHVVNLGGRTVMPGLIDAHLHLQHLALSRARLDCETSSPEDCLARVAERSRELPPGRWILGHGWNQNRWGEFPTRHQLDLVAPDHPVYLTAKSLHAGWANSRALSLAGLGRSSPDPADGRLQREASGDLTGILLEGAMRLVAAVVPAPSASDVVRAVEALQPTLWAVGLTAVHDFDGPECFAALQVLHEGGTLGLRVLKSLPVDRLSEALALGLRSGFGDDWLKLGAVKIFADGALGPRTAAMLEPYAGEPSNQGTLLQDRESLLEIARQALPAGLALAVHAIGDRANHEVIEAFEASARLLAQVALPAMPSRIEHVQLLHPDDVRRLAPLRLVASMQPIHATSDMPMAERYWGDRCRTSYAWRSLRRAGAQLVFGSDAPVESPNPFWGLHAAMTRRRHDGSPGPEGWIPDERLDRQEALDAYTGAPAQLAGNVGKQGVLRVGAWGDLLVLDQDPLTCPVDELPWLRPSGTMVGGQWRLREF